MYDQASEQCLTISIKGSTLEELEHFERTGEWPDEAGTITETQHPDVPGDVRSWKEEQHPRFLTGSRLLSRRS